MSSVIVPPSGVSDPFLEAQATGLLDGYFRSRVSQSINIIGRRAGFNSISVLQDVKEYNAVGADATDRIVDLVGTEPLEITSSSASDTNAAGTGAQTVKVTYIDSVTGLIVQSAALALNGVANVACGFTAKAILWAEVITVGSNTTAVGNITIRNATDHTTNYEQISAGGNRSLSGYFMIPTGFTGYLSSWSTGCLGSQDVRIQALVDSSPSGPPTLGTVYRFLDQAFVVNTGRSENLNWRPLPAGCRIKVSTLPGGTAAAANRVDASFSILLVSNT